MKVKVYKIRLDDAHLREDQKMLDDFLQNHEILKYETAFVRDTDCYWSVVLYYESCAIRLNENPVQEYPGEPNSEVSPELSAVEEKILQSLKEWRSGKAKTQRLPVYFIATNTELLTIAKSRPACKEALCEIKGFGKHKIENYGAEIIEILETV